MRNTTIELGDLAFANDRPMALFGGMNVLESRDIALRVAEHYVAVCERLDGDARIGRVVRAVERKLTRWGVAGRGLRRGTRRLGRRVRRSRILRARLAERLGAGLRGHGRRHRGCGRGRHVRGARHRDVWIVRHWRNNRRLRSRLRCPRQGHLGLSIVRVRRCVRLLAYVVVLPSRGLQHAVARRSAVTSREAVNVTSPVP